jgi:2-oxoisovalerate dehydrogenase E2 component (dihydrolipoyl transacylase)
VSGSGGCAIQTNPSRPVGQRNDGTKTMKTFHLPDLGEGLQEAEIVSWHVGPGDQVVADQPLVSVETDKAVVEVPSPRAGRIGELFGAEGDIVKVGAPLVAFEDAAAADTGTVVGEIPASEQRAEEATAAERAGAAVGVKATPAVRALARRKGVDLALISPSGPDGVINAADVERAAADLAEAGPLEPLRGVRRAMATRMAHAHAEVVPATVSDDADLDAWTDGDVTIRIVRAIVAGCAAEPALNAWYDSQQQGRRLHPKIDLGIAVDTEDGLFVPVLRDVAKRAPDDLRRGLERMKVDILARKIPPEELRGATITLSNFGTLSGRYAAPVVVPPQVAILSTGRIASRVVAVDGRPAVHKVMPLSLTFDHRVVTGGEAARFLAAVIADLERPS